MRDVEHEQISESTNDQLTDRLEQIRSGAILISETLCYGHRELREMHRIISELYCRACLQKSQPGVIVCPPRAFTESLHAAKAGEHNAH